jgi:hypothetical protein
MVERNQHSVSYLTKLKINTEFKNSYYINMTAAMYISLKIINNISNIRITTYAMFRQEFRDTYASS